MTSAPWFGCGTEWLHPHGRARSVVAPAPVPAPTERRPPSPTFLSRTRQVPSSTNSRRGRSNALVQRPCYGRQAEQRLFWRLVRWAVGIFLSGAAVLAAETSSGAASGGVATGGTAGNVPVVLVAFEGQVEILRSGTGVWTLALTNAVLLPGDRLRTGADGRALIRTSPGNLARLRSASVLEIKPVPQRPGTLLNLLRGFFHFFDRDQSAEVEIQDGLASATSLGTDFAIAVSDAGEVKVGVYDGRVRLGNGAGMIELKSGEVGRAVPGILPDRPPGIALDTLVQWTWYFPMVVDPLELPLTADESVLLQESLAAYRRGAVLEALRAWPANVPNSVGVRLYRAALNLAIGEVPGAEEQVRFGEGTGAALALRWMAAVTQLGEGWESMAGLEGAGASASVDLARSYALQAGRRWEEALASARAARERSPEWGAAWAREAELLFSQGRLGLAEEALDRALAVSPDLPTALTLRGFVLAGRNRIREARGAMERAIAVHSGYSQAWLGRGLVRIREGDREGGLEDLLTAAALEPRRSFLRSYLGKAFAEVGRMDAAAHELELARDLDPRDPTGWFYAALQAQGGNRVNEAIRLLEAAQDRNENRALYRSQMLLDQDRAVRAANLARFYQDAGMPEVATREAVHAVEADYSNYSAHLFLANSYFGLRDPNLFALRYDTPAFSEYLIANLLAPVGAGTLSPTLSQSEYSKLFERDGFGVVADSEYLGRGAWTVSGSQFGTFGNSAYALEGKYRTDPGQWRNGEVEQRELSLQWKQQVSPSDTLWFRVADFESDGGDLFAAYDPSLANPSVHFERQQRPGVSAGLHHAWRPGVHTLFLAGRAVDEVGFVDPLASSLVLARFAGDPADVRNLGFQHQYASDLAQYHVEGQQIWETERFRTISGVAGRWGSVETESLMDKPSEIAGLFREPASDARIEENVSRVGVYLYETWSPFRTLDLTAGVGYDHQEFPRYHRSAPIQAGLGTEDSWLPKAGFLWRPWRGGVLRGAYARTASGGGFNPVLQLEPTHVAGILQAYRSVLPETLAETPAGSAIDVFGLAFEQRWSTGTYVGVLGEWLESEDTSVSGAYVLDFDAFGDLKDLAYPGSMVRELAFRERALTMTVDQMLGDWLTVGVAWRLQEAWLETGHPEVAALGALPQDRRHEALLNQVTPRVAFNHPSGVFATFSARWLDSSNRADDAGLEDDTTWQLDTWVGYRFRRRQAEVAVGWLNMLDEDYRLNPVNTLVLPPRESTVAVRLGIRF